MFTIKELKQLYKKHQGSADDSLVIEQVTTDSRLQVAHSLFIPIVGENFNGHHYVEQAIKNGAVAVVWDEKENIPASVPANFPVFYTSDTTESLQQLAKYYRDKINPTVIGITGSNGKTTTKDLVFEIAKTTYRTHATLGNLNNHIGLPLTILNMPRDTEMLVLELGMSDFGEIEVLTKIATPDYAIITNIGESHIEYLGSREGIAKAKLEIVSGLKENGVLILDGDEPLLNEIHTNQDYLVLRCGFSEDNHLQIIGSEITVDGTNFTIANKEIFQVPLFGEHHAKNAAYALQLAELLQIPIEKQKEALLSLRHTSMRFELLPALNGAVIVNDSYNASPTSMKGAIEVIKQIEGFSEKTLVLGDILELGSFSDKMHLEIADVITAPITHLYTYGEKAKLITDKVKEKQPDIRSAHFATKESLVAALAEHLSRESLVLFKASRGLQFETMVDELVIEQDEQ